MVIAIETAFLDSPGIDGLYAYAMPQITIIGLLTATLTSL